MSDTEKRTTYTDSDTLTDASIYKELYDALDRFKSIKPWEIFCEVDVCEICLPDCDETYYCSIRGMFEELNGLSVYEGQDGLISLSNFINATELPDYVAVSRKNCLDCTWDSREAQKKRDLSAVKLAGKKYRGAGGWPLLRQYETGYEPYFMNETQMKTFTRVTSELYNALNELGELGKTENLTEGERIRRSFDTEKGIWVNELIPPIDKIEAVTDGCVITDELLIRRLKKKPLNGSSIELDMPYIPAPIRTNSADGRGFYPRLCIFCDVERASAENQYFVNRTDDPRDVLLSMLVGYIEEKGRPSAIYVRDPEIFGIIGHLCSKIDVELYFTSMLNMLDFFVNDIIDRFTDN